MDIRNPIMDVHNPIMGIHDCIKDNTSWKCNM